MRWTLTFTAGAMAVLTALALPSGVAAIVPTDERETQSSPVKIEHLGTMPLDAGYAVGARLVGKRFFVTTQKQFSIYDVGNPTAPNLLSTTPVGFKCCNEDVATNGKILLFSETFPEHALHVWDVSGRLPSKLAEIDIPRQHTVTCILDCRWAYGAEGAILDLREPAAPRLAGEWPVDAIPTHDFEEIRTGFLVNAPTSEPWSIETWDVRRPLKPRVVASANAAPPGPAESSWFHQAAWPRGGHDRFLVMGAEGVPGPVMVFDTRNWIDDSRLRLVDRYLVDGPPGEDSSSHWLQIHPAFRNGGLVVAAWKDFGTRVLEIGPSGKIAEVGFFQPPLGAAEAAYWITDEVVYVVDRNRGIDILKITRR